MYIFILISWAINRINHEITLMFIDTRNWWRTDYYLKESMKNSRLMYTFSVCSLHIWYSMKANNKRCQRISVTWHSYDKSWCRQVGMFSLHQFFFLRFHKISLPLFRIHSWRLIKQFEVRLINLKEKIINGKNVVVHPNFHWWTEATGLVTSGE